MKASEQIFPKRMTLCSFIQIASTSAAFVVVVSANTLPAIAQSVASRPAVPHHDSHDTEGYDPHDLIYENIFGITGITETGDKGDRGAGIETDFRLGKRDGRYFAASPKFFYSYTFADDWYITTNAFIDRHRIRNVSSLPADANRWAFDGLSLEIGHRILRRSPGNPFAVAVAFEPRWGRVDGVSGLQTNSFSGEFKFLIDAIVVPGLLFWGANATFAPGEQRNIATRSKWLKGSGASLSTAFAVAVSDRATLGAEVRYQMQYNSLGISRFAGAATFLGPTGVLRLGEQVSINGAFLVQVAGRAKSATPGARYDLDNFERRVVRFGLHAGF